MAKDTATTRVVMYSGTHGNSVKEVLKAMLAADAAATEFNMGVIPAGVEITDLSVVTDNLGALTNVDVGYRYVDPDHGTDSVAYWGNFTTATAARLASSAKPVRFENAVMVVATLKGAAGTGDLIVMPSGITRGVR